MVAACVRGRRAEEVRRPHTFSPKEHIHQLWALYSRTGASCRRVGAERPKRSTARPTQPSVGAAALVLTGRVYSASRRAQQPYCSNSAARSSASFHERRAARARTALQERSDNDSVAAAMCSESAVDSRWLRRVC